MNFGYLPKFITILCMVINFSGLAEVHHRASLRSAIYSILIRLTLVLLMTATGFVAESRMKTGIGIRLLIGIE